MLDGSGVVLLRTQLAGALDRAGLEAKLEVCLPCLLFFGRGCEVVFERRRSGGELVLKRVAVEERFPLEIAQDKGQGALFGEGIDDGFGAEEKVEQLVTFVDFAGNADHFGRLIVLIALVDEAGFLDPDPIAGNIEQTMFAAPVLGAPFEAIVEGSFKAGPVFRMDALVPEGFAAIQILFAVAEDAIPDGADFEAMADEVP